MVEKKTATPWRRVVFAADCDEDGNCPVCSERNGASGIDYADCGCPGPTMDDYEYREVRGELWARADEAKKRAAREAAR